MRGFMLLVGAGFLLGAATPAAPQTPPALQTPSTGAPSPLLAPTVKEFLAACATDQFGCANRVAGTLLANSAGASAPHLCLSSDDYTAAIPTWLKAHPETAAMPTDQGIVLALKTLYAC